MARLQYKLGCSVARGGCGRPKEPHVGSGHQKIGLVCFWSNSVKRFSLRLLVHCIFRNCGTEKKVDNKWAGKEHASQVTLR